MYRVIILPVALKDLSKLDKTVAQRVSDKLTRLQENIEALNLLPLTGTFSGFYKLKVGDHRITYEISHKEKVISVHKIGHRREIYR